MGTVGTVGIVVTTYNNAEHFSLLIDSIKIQSYKDLSVIVADDGSSEEEVKAMKNHLSNSSLDFELLELEHGERGVARVKAIDRAIKIGAMYLLIVDSDMYLEEGLLEEAIRKVMTKDVGALIVKEIPYSNSDNFFTKVKVFERTVLNSSDNDNLKNSIEAARFWRTTDYIKSGGINSKQIAFEEIQPTLRYLERGGSVGRVHTKGLYHDEKKVTFMDLINKKKYYFSKMESTFSTEEKGFIKALKRYYFFRPVLYTKTNFVRYIKHPVLFAGMMYMYLALTFVALTQVMKQVAGRIRVSKSYSKKNLSS